MKMIFGAFVAVMTFAGCERTDLVLDEVMEADRAFSRMSSEQGMAKAFIEYADENVIKLNNGEFPTIGKQEMIKSMTAEEFRGKLTWEPLIAKLDGDLAYTFGDWQMQIKSNEKDTLIFGNYVTIWKRQSNGKWKFVLDAGNPTPGPTPSEMIRKLN